MGATQLGRSSSIETIDSYAIIGKSESTVSVRSPSESSTPGRTHQRDVANIAKATHIDKSLAPHTRSIAGNMPVIREPIASLASAHIHEPTERSAALATRASSSLRLFSSRQQVRQGARGNRQTDRSKERGSGCPHAWRTIDASSSPDQTCQLSLF